MPTRLLFAPLLIGFCMGGGSLRAAAHTLLVVNQRDRTLSLVDPESGTQVAVVDEGLAGVRGHEIAASPDGRTAYMPIYGSAGVGNPGIDGHELLVIDLESRRIVGDIDFGHAVRPHLPVFDPATGLLYVTTELDNTVTVIEERFRLWTWNRGARLP